jgi:trehalose-6-phosphatase
VLDRFAWPGALPVYLGDDDKDEDAFEAIKTRQGVALLVAAILRTTLADAQLGSPPEARDWLHQLAERLERQTAAVSVLLHSHH